MKSPIPDFAWYSAESTRLDLRSPRCPFASVHACPRYYQSLALLGGAGCTSIPKAEDDALKTKWEKHPLWPATGEQETAISGGDDGPNAYHQFCPEVAYDTFGLFATFLGRHVGEIDRDLAASRLGKEGAAHDDPRWTWCGITPQHYSACPLYSPLSHGIGKIKSVRVARPKPPMSASAMKPRSKIPAPKHAMANDVVFISYAHADAKWLTRLERHLKPLLHGSKIQAWSDKKIKTGDKWGEKIQGALTHAKAAVLLVSSHFLASDYIRHYELPRILKNEKGKGLRIFQLILSPCAFEAAKFEYQDSRKRKQTIKLSDFQAANAPSKTLREMKAVEQERILLQVAQEISGLIETSPRKTLKAKNSTRSKRKPISKPSSKPITEQPIEPSAQMVDPPANEPIRADGLLSSVLQPFRAARAKALAISCTNNLKQVGLAARIWANDHGDRLPNDFNSMKRELHDLRITCCPAAHKATQYSIVSAGESCLNPAVVYALCPYHKHALLVDGSVQALGNQKLIKQNGQWLIKQDHHT